MVKRSWSMNDKKVVSLPLEKELMEFLRDSAIKNERTLCEEIRFRLKLTRNREFLKNDNRAGNRNSNVRSKKFPSRNPFPH